MAEVSSGFIGPLRRGDTRASAPFQGPVRAGTDVEHFRRTGRSRSIGGGSSSSSRDRTSDSNSAAEAAARILAQEKAQNEAAARLTDIKAKQELNKITAMQVQILRDKGRVTQKISRDVKTKNVLRITEYKQNGNKVTRVVDTVTGEITFNAYAPGRGGGSVRRVAGVTLNGKAKDKGFGEKLVRFDPNKVNVNLKKQEAGFTTLDLSNRLTGLERISSYTKREARVLVKKLESGGGLSVKDKAILLGLQFAIPSQQLIIGLKQLPTFVSFLVKNPKNIIKVPGQILTGLKESGLEIIALGKVSPALAIARIGGEIITFKAVSSGLKITGKVTGVAAKSISSVLKPIRGGAVIARTATKGGFVKFKVVSKKAGRAITKRSKVAMDVSKEVRKIKVGVKKIRKIVKEIRKKEIGQFKSSEEYRKVLNRARKTRKLARKKGKTKSIGDNDFIDGVAIIEEISDRLAISQARKFIGDFKIKGGKLTLNQKDAFIRAVQRHIKNELNKSPRFKNLKEYSKLTKPYQIRFVKSGKIITAKKLTKGLTFYVEKIPLVQFMNKLIKKIKGSIGAKDIRQARKGFKRLKKLGRGAKAKEIRKFKSALEKRALLKSARKIRRISRRKISRRARVRFKIINQKNVKKVTFQKLKRSQSVSQLNKFIDDFFSEVQKRRGLNIKDLEVRQFKNIMKKRLAKAINTGDKKRILDFELKINKMINDMNKVGNNPTVKIIEKGSKPRIFRTIRDFTPETPKGRYVEVRRGQQMLVQEVKVVQKAIQKPKVYIIQNVAKKPFSFTPLVNWGIDSFSAQVIKTINKDKIKQKLRSGQVLSAKQISKVLQDSAQDFKVLQVVSQSISPRLNVAQRVAQDVKSRLRSGQKLKTKQVTKKKKVFIKRKIKKPKKTRTLSKSVMTYAFVVKKSGRNVRLKIPPMTLRDSWDVGSFRLDHDLQQTGTLIPVGMRNVVAKVSKSVKGYYGKHKKKFRRFRVKKGKRFTLKRTIIEKRKYINDLKSERIALKKARARKRKIKRSPIKRRTKKRRQPQRRTKTTKTKRRKKR